MAGKIVDKSLKMGYNISDIQERGVEYGGRGLQNLFVQSRGFG